MPRRTQFVGEYIYHAMNRSAKRVQLFESPADYSNVEDLMLKAKTITGIRFLDYCIMPNHFHFIIWPTASTEMSQFMKRFTGGHAQLWQAMRESTGSGAVYQGRYKAIPVQTGRCFYNVCRYVQRNPLRAGLVRRAEEWRWSSLWRRVNGEDVGWLDPWPVPYPTDWLETLNGTDDVAGADEVRKAIRRGIPFGDADWIKKTANVVGLKHKLRSPGRPKTRGEIAPDPFLPDA